MRNVNTYHGLAYSVQGVIASDDELMQVPD